MSSHDDCECTFASEQKPRILDLMMRCLPPARAREIRQILLRYPGSHVSWNGESSDLQVFATFEDDLAALPPGA